MIQLRADKAAAILAPKVEGTRVLGELFESARLDFMLLCSSRSSILGGFGQIDYCAANAFLDAFAHYYTARTETFTVSIDWDGWQEVGMLVNAAAQYGVSGATAAGSYQKHDHPLLETLAVETDGRETYLTQFSVADKWILEEHRIGGTAVLPGVTYLEMARAAFEKHSGGGPVELRDVFFITPMGIGDDERREVRLELEKYGDGYKFRASSRPAVQNGASPKWQDHAIGEIGPAPSRPPRRHDLGELARMCNAREFVVGDEELDPDLGPRWQNIRKVYLGEREMLVLFGWRRVRARFGEAQDAHSCSTAPPGRGCLHGAGRVYLPMSYTSCGTSSRFPARSMHYIKETENNYSKKRDDYLRCLIHGRGRDGELVEIEEFSERESTT